MELTITHPNHIPVVVHAPVSYMKDYTVHLHNGIVIDIIPTEDCLNIYVDSELVMIVKSIGDDHNVLLDNQRFIVDLDLKIMIIDEIHIYH